MYPKPLKTIASSAPAPFLLSLLIGCSNVATTEPDDGPLTDPADTTSLIPPADPPPSPADTTPPTLSNGQPVGELVAGTTATVVKVHTDEPASCKWSPQSGTDFEQMAPFATTGSTQHETTYSGLQDGTAYGVHVRCVDQVGNINQDDFSFGFSVGVAPSPTGAPVISNGHPTGELVGGKKSTVITVTTDAVAACGWSGVSGVPYAQMSPFSSTGGKVHVALYDGLRDGRLYSVHVRCRDHAGNVNQTDYAFAFSVGHLSQPVPSASPKILSALPARDLAPGTKRIVVQVLTDAFGGCAWSDQGGTEFSEMTYFAAYEGNPTPHTKGHHTPMSGLQDGGSYQLYVRCFDVDGNTNRDDFVVQFTVGQTPLPPSDPVRVSSLAVATGRSYRILDEGLFATDFFRNEPRVDQYVDRVRRFRSIPPQFEGLTLISTANDDKNSLPGSSDFLSFDINASAAIMVAQDDRVQPRPEWLTSRFVDTGINIYNEKDNDDGFSIFLGVFAAGRVTLGSNVVADGGSSISMYSVIVAPAALVSYLLR